MIEVVFGCGIGMVVKALTLSRKIRSGKNREADENQVAPVMVIMMGV